MGETRDRNRFETAKAALTALLVLVVMNILYISTQIPETAVGSPGRHVVDAMHMSWGIAAFVLVVARLIIWYLDRPALPPAGMSANAFGLWRDLSLTMLIVILLETLIGPVRAWAEGGFEVGAFGFFSLPKLVPSIYEIRVVAGYSHSALSFFLLYMTPIWGLVGLYYWLVYDLKAIPPLPRLLPQRGA